MVKITRHPTHALCPHERHVIGDWFGWVAW